MFDEAKAQRAVEFIRCLKHTKGRWRGQAFDLLPWQETIIRDVFGTVKADVVAKYIRLSDEDVDTGRGVKQESDSVVSQRRLLDGFIEGDAGLKKCRIIEFCDDGFSGTDFVEVR